MLNSGLVTRGPIEIIKKQIVDYSMSGYRTLVICKRLMSKEVGEVLMDEMKKAKSIVNNSDRLARVEEVQAKCECDLEVFFFQNCSYSCGLFCSFVFKTIIFFKAFISMFSIKA